MYVDANLRLTDERYTTISVKACANQEHPREGIVELQVLHQDGINSLPYNGLKPSIIIAHVYDIF